MIVARSLSDKKGQAAEKKRNVWYVVLLMGFGEIYERWLREHGESDHRASAERESRDYEDARTFARPSSRTEFRKRLPQATIDLHGMREVEARAAVRSFIGACAARGLEKVSIIHGKGNHSRDEQVLANVVREELEKNSRAGEFEFADSQHGGRGATWVRIRQVISRDK